MFDILKSYSLANKGHIVLDSYNANFVEDRLLFQKDEDYTDTMVSDKKVLYNQRNGAYYATVPNNFLWWYD